MAPAQLGHTVQVYYTCRLDDGAIFDASAQDVPFEFTLGTGHAIAGLEQAVAGMCVGEDKTVLIHAEQAHGRRQPEKVVAMPRRKMPDHIQPRVGQRLQFQQLGQPTIAVTVVEVTDLHVFLDANHPLAGKDLTFDIILAAVVGAPLEA
jgi:FKBP-type peptidyl-prolyl cis-trans isomerase 2